MKITIAKKLSLSFGAVLLLMIISGLITYSFIVDNEKIQSQVINLRVKTVLLGKDVTNGINKSLAALRGYMILGENPQKAQAMKSSREAAWKEIDNAVSQFDRLAKNWTVAENIRRLKNMKSELDAFKVAQQEIQDISHTNANIASYNLLLTQAAPRAGKMLSAISAIIDEESTLRATKERKDLLKNLADARGSFAIGLANIRAYLLSGKDNFKVIFNEKWRVNEQRVSTIDSEQVALFTDTQMNHWQTFTRIRNEFKSLPNEMFELRSADDWNKANYWLGTKAAPRATKILSILGEMKVSQDRLLAEDTAEATSVVQSLKTNIILMTIISLIVGVVCSLLFSKNLLERLSVIVSRAQHIADGDMTGKALSIKGEDELADLTRAMNQMSVSLNSVVTKAADSMVNASKGTNEILTANQEMSDGVDSQSAQVEQISAAIEELSNSSLEVASNCMTASESSEGALKLAQSGGSIVQESLSHMVSIKDAFDKSSEAITSLSTQSKQIEDILSVIRGIADQTNLLALNAAIEAARAGEQGRGFAVVADEVRQLASRTTTATSEVESAIDSMRRETESAVVIMAEGADKVDQGVDMSNSAASSLSDIITSVDDVVSKIQAIAATAEEQTMTTAEIAQNTESVSSSSQQIQAGVSNVVLLSERVTKDTTEQSDELLAMV